jgi:23S rRNA (cytidine1920-2'-O)/16S rRNA (cytidine1409-2'-O)-methyltransferase
LLLKVAVTGEKRLRLDEALVAAGLAPSRSRARDMIRRGTVTVDGEPEVKPGRKIRRAERLGVADPGARYVSRAALKLVAGLDAFGFDPRGLTILDLGASTGGFTEVLLERGAACVIAVDVGHGQLDLSLAGDPRVVLLEGLNARHLTKEHLAGRRIEGIVADLSFISLRLALPPALGLAEPAAWGLLLPDNNDRQRRHMPWGIFLVKPQFEVGKAFIGKGGIVRDSVAAKASVDGIADWIEREQGWKVIGLVPSPITGSDGNQECLLGAILPSHPG